MSREDSVREIAYAIWESEGRPDGKETEHWMRAEAQVGGESFESPGAPLNPDPLISLGGD